METLSLTIDGQEVKAKIGETVLRTVQRAGIYIPALCDHPDLSPSGDCRLCLVQIAGMSDFAISCTTPAAEGMVIYTNTRELEQARRQALGKILAEHPHTCLICDRKERCKPFDICLRNVAVTERCVTCPKNGRCELQKVVDYIGIEEMPELVEQPDRAYRKLPIERDNPFFDRDYNLCIACGRCVRACRDLRGIEAIDFVQRNGYRVAGPVKGTLSESGCKFCFTCVEVCPTGALIDRAARYKDILDREAYVVPCQDACPAHIDIPRYVYLIAQGEYSAALAVIREKVPFPATLGRVCIHPCEQACRREQLNEPICIKFLKRFAADHDMGLWKQNSKVAPPTDKQVAVVGSGPAGLTAAFYLAKLGHKVTVFEALPELGGMMRVGIPAYRLPREVLAAEIDEISKVGVEMKTNTRVESLDNLFEQGYNAIFVAVGAHGGIKLGVQGEDSPAVIECVTFLRKVSLGEKVEVGNRVGVIGGGNAAIDSARSALRLGAKEVTIVYRRTRAEMPASPEEIEEALHEGVQLIYLAAPNKISTNGGGASLECLRMKLGEPDASGRRRPVPIKGSEFVMDFDTIVAAIGQRPVLPSESGLKAGRGNVIEADRKTLATEKKGVFAGGDAVLGPASVIEAIAAGRQAAISIDNYLGGSGIIDETLTGIEEPSPWFGRDGDFASRRGAQIPSLPAAQRLGDFREVELGFSEETAIEEAKRCLKCDHRLKISPVMLPPSISKVKVESQTRPSLVAAHHKS